MNTQNLTFRTKYDSRNRLTASVSVCLIASVVLGGCKSDGSPDWKPWAEIGGRVLMALSAVGDSNSSPTTLPAPQTPSPAPTPAPPPAPNDPGDPGDEE